MPEAKPKALMPYPKGQNILILTDEMDIISILFLLKGKENWIYFLFFKRISPKGFPKESPVT